MNKKKTHTLSLRTEFFFFIYIYIADDASSLNNLHLSLYKHSIDSTKQMTVFRFRNETAGARIGKCYKEQVEH